MGSIVHGIDRTLDLKYFRMHSLDLTSLYFTMSSSRSRSSSATVVMCPRIVPPLDQRFTDLTLRTADGAASVRTFKALIAARSGLIANLLDPDDFDVNKVDSTPSVLELDFSSSPHLTSEALVQLVRLVNGEELDFDRELCSLDKVVALRRMADYLDVSVAKKSMADLLHGREDVQSQLDRMVFLEYRDYGTKKSPEAVLRLYFFALLARDFTAAGQLLGNIIEKRVPQAVDVRALALRMEDKLPGHGAFCALSAVESLVAYWECSRGGDYRDRVQSRLLVSVEELETMSAKAGVRSLA
jgi:hypothetical protein